jgi:hypothetical protein
MLGKGAKNAYIAVPALSGMVIVQQYSNRQGSEGQQGY